MPCRLITYDEALHLAHIDQVMREGARMIRECLAARECAYCPNPLEPWQTYPTCRECANRRGYTLR